MARRQIAITFTSSSYPILNWVGETPMIGNDPSDPAGVLICDLVPSELGGEVLRPVQMNGLTADAVDMLQKEREGLKSQVSKLEGAMEQQDKELVRVQAERDEYLRTTLRLTKLLLAKEEEAGAARHPV